MLTVLRHYAILLALGALSVTTSVAALDAQGPDARETRASAPATHACAQLPGVVAVDASTGTPHCPSTPMASAAVCGGPVALSVDSRVQLGADCAAKAIGTRPRQARDLLLVTPVFRPPIV